MQEATGSNGAPVFFSASATDDVDGPVAVTCDPASGATFPLGATTVTCTASDARGNTGSASFTVTVRDTTPPVLTVPADATVGTTDPAGAIFTYSAGASDLVDGSVAVSCEPVSGARFPLGLTTARCSASDRTGNATASSFTVTVTFIDVIPPVVIVPGPLVAEATRAAGAVVSFTATASDNIDGPLTPTCGPTSGSTFPVGSTTVSCTAIDAHANVGSASFTITVRDTTPPVLMVPLDTKIRATSPAGAIFIYSAAASDLVNGSVPVTCTPPSGAQFPKGRTTVGCSVTDAAGNRAIGSFTVQVTGGGNDGRAVSQRVGRGNFDRSG
jgi:hypothetical protein